MTGYVFAARIQGVQGFPDEVLGVNPFEGPIEAPWIHVKYALSEFSAYDSCWDAEAYTYSTDPDDPISVLLPGSKFEVRWTIVCADAAPCTAVPTHFDNETVIWFGGKEYHFSDLDRNVVLKYRGARLWVNVVESQGVTGMRLELPAGGLVEVAGVRH